MNLIIILPIIAALAFLLTAILRRYALANSVIDVPNDRSSIPCLLHGEEASL